MFLQNLNKETKKKKIFFNFSNLIKKKKKNYKTPKSKI